MADVDVVLRWTGAGLVFQGGVAGAGAPQAVLDGEGKAGPSPMQALLLALASCTAADVVSILERMRVPLSGLEVEVAGTRTVETPRRYTAVRLLYRVRGVPAESESKLRRAVSLSQERYCSVLHTLRADVVVESDVALA
jgi:putative redox protein